MAKTLLKSLFFTLAYALVGYTSYAQTMPPVVIVEDSDEPVNAGLYVHYLVDSAGDLDINTVSRSLDFRQSEKQIPNYSKIGTAAWYKIAVVNNSVRQRIRIDIENPAIDIIEYYYPQKAGGYGLVRYSDKSSFSERAYNYADYIFDLEIGKHDTAIVYIRVESIDIQSFPVFIGTSRAIFNKESKQYMILGIYIGLMVVMLLYNLFIYFTVRDNSYLYYVMYIFAVLFTQVAHFGIPFQYVWPDFLWLQKHCLFLLPAFAGTSGLGFMQHFLQSDKHIPRFNKIAYLMYGLYVIGIAAMFLGNYDFSFHFIQGAASLTSLYIIIAAALIYRKGYRPAGFFLIAWSLFLLGIILFVLGDTGVIPYNKFSSYTMPVGSALEVLLLSLALADRINILKKEKEQSQAEVLAALQENEKLIKEQNVILEQRVEERTMELRETNEELKVTLDHLKETQGQLVDAEKMASLGQLTAGIAHEINNPINFVSANIKPLQMDIADVLEVISKYETIADNDQLESKLAEIAAFKKKIDLEYVKTEINVLLSGIEDGAKRTAEIVKGLKNFSRLDESDVKSANINEGIESTLILLRSNIPDNIEVVKQLGTLPMIECLPGKLNQVFMNVMNNAVQAIVQKKSKEKETLTLSTYEKDGNVIISIKDTGVGMTPEVKAKVFEPFFTTKDVGEGTGLGLSIVFKIIESHQGKIEMRTEFGNGTEVIITLPQKITLS